MKERSGSVLLAALGLNLWTVFVAVASVWAWRTYIEPPRAEPAAPPAYTAVQPTVVTFAVPPTPAPTPTPTPVQPPKPEAKAPVVQPPAPPPPPPAPPAKNATAPRSAPPLLVWNPEAVMAKSKAGQKLAKYAADYAAVMDANVKTLNDAIAAKDKGLNVPEARRLIKQFGESKKAVAEETAAFLRSLVSRAAEGVDEWKGAPLVETSAVTRGANARDVSERLIEVLDAVNVNLPAVPKPLQRRTNPQPKEQPAKSSKKK